jgi:cation:H+ antiporter
LEYLVRLILGLVLLAVGAPMLVFGSARLDRRIGRDPFSVGLAAVAFGPCLAGLTLDLALALNPAPELHPYYSLAEIVGHVAGNTVAGVGLVLGVAALVRPVVATARLFYTAIPLVLVAALVFWFFTLNKVISRAAAGVLLAAGGLAATLLARAAKSEPEAVRAELTDWVPERLAVWRAMLLAGAGLAALLGGAVLAARALIPAGSALRLSAPVIGETVVSFGTALPALGAAAVASYRGRPNLTLSIAVGFVLFNLLLVVGAAAMVEPLPLTQHALTTEIPAVVLLFTSLLFPVLLNGLKVPRWAGAVLLVVYVTFMVWQVRRVP